MTKLEEYRARFPEYNDLDDETLMRKRHAKYYSDIPYEEYRARMTGGAAAPERMAGGATPVAQPTAPLSPRYESYGRAHSMSPFKVLPEMAAEAGKDIFALGTGMAAAQNPGTMARLAVDSPEMVRRGTAAAAGTAAGFLGGPATGAATRMGAGPLLARILGGGIGGAAAGATDAGIRTGGDVRSTVAGGTLGALLGGGAGAVTRGGAARVEKSPPEGAAYRAIGPTELESIRTSGKIKSNSSMALPIERHLGLTAFADSPEDAAMYARLNLGNEGDAYIVEVSPHPTMRRDWTELPEIAKRRANLERESAKLRETLSKQPPEWEERAGFQKWLADNEREVADLSRKTEGVSSEALAGAPAGARLPYRQTPEDLPASSITRMWRVGADGSLSEVPFSQGGHAASQRPYNPLRSVEERLKGAGDPGEEIVRRVRAADTEGSIRAGQVEAKMAEARPTSFLDRLLPGRRKQIAAEEDRIGDALRGVIDPASLSDRERRLYDVLHEYRGTVVPRAREAGLDVGEQPNYFPQGTLTPKELRGKVGKQSMEASVRAGRFPDMTAAQAHADDYIKWIESGGREGGALQGDEATKNLLLKMARNPKSDSFANLELARETNHPFFDPSPTRAFRRYAEGAERRIAEAREWGPDAETLKGLIGSIKDPRLQEQVKKLTTVATGQVEEMGPSIGSRVLAGSRRLSTLKLSPTSSIRNLSQSMNSLLASDPSSFATGLARSLTKRGRMLPVENGALTDEATHQVHRLLGGDGGGIEAYMAGIGFSPTERINRTIASNVGWRYVQKVAKGLKQNPKSEFLRGELRALELDPDAVIAQGGLSARDLLAATKVFVDRTQFKQRPLDVPAMFTESLIGRNVLQFKGFTAQQGRLLAQETLDRMRSGDPRNVARGLRNIALLATAFPLTGEATNDIVAAMQGRKRESKGLERWYENLVYAGGLGLFSDAIESLKYGSLAYLAGPSLGTMTDVADIGIRAGGRAKEGRGLYLTRGEGKRLFRQIPVAGPLLARRVFPDEEKGKKSKARKRKEER